MTNAVHKGKNWGIRDGQLCPSSLPKKNKIFGTILNVQVDADISFPHFKHQPMPWLAMFIYHC